MKSGAGDGSLVLFVFSGREGLRLGGRDIWVLGFALLCQRKRFVREKFGSVVSFGSALGESFSEYLELFLFEALDCFRRG